MRGWVTHSFLLQLLIAALAFSGFPVAAQTQPAVTVASMSVAEFPHSRDRQVGQYSAAGGDGYGRQ